MKDTRSQWLKLRDEYYLSETDLNIDIINKLDRHFTFMIYEKDTPEYDLVITYEFWYQIANNCNTVILVLQTA